MGVEVVLGSKYDLAADPQSQSEMMQQQFMKAHQPSFITEEENTIKAQLTNAKFTHKEAIAVLIQHLAYANFRMLFLSVDKFIFPEQIQLLKHLNSEYQLSKSSDLVPFYNDYLKRVKVGEVDTTGFKYEDFLKFLLNFKFIMQEGNGYRISPIGRDYLAYVVRSGRSI